MRVNAHPDPSIRLVLRHEPKPLSPVVTFICGVFGHNWPDPRAVGTDLYRVACNRCSRVLLGDWHEIERNHAWRHH